MTIPRGHCGSVYSTRFLADNSRLLSCSEDISVRYWYLVSFPNTVLYQKHAYPVWDVGISPCGLYLAVVPMTLPPGCDPLIGCTR
ncbi:hypothetical protein ACRRTK_000494 [Alexandromys fortis]